MKLQMHDGMNKLISTRYIMGVGSKIKVLSAATNPLWLLSQ